MTGILGEATNVEPPSIDNDRCGRIVHEMTQHVQAAHDVQLFNGLELLQIGAGYLACTIVQMTRSAADKPEAFQHGVKAELLRRSIDLLVVMLLGPTAEVEFANSDTELLNWLEGKDAVIHAPAEEGDFTRVKFMSGNVNDRYWVTGGGAETLREAIRAAMTAGQSSAAPPAQRQPWMKGTLHKCRVCGCTDDDCTGCIAKTGQPCHWVAEDLCSACQDRPLILTPEGGAAR